MSKGAKASMGGVSEVHDFSDDGWDGVGIKISVTPSFDEARNFFGVKRKNFAIYDFAGSKDFGF